ncbi:MAG: GNAT family N-acetyltransferase [Caldilineaceae bacterium]
MSNLPNLQNDFQLRTPTVSDIPDLVALHNKCWRALSGNDVMTEAILRSEWESPSFDPERDCHLAISAAGQIVGMANIHNRPPYVNYYSDVQVDPEWQRRGIGSALNQWVETSIAARLAQAPAEARVQVNGNILSTHMAARQLLLDQGYQHTRSFYEMDVVLTTQPAAPTFPEGITLKPFNPDLDKEAAYLAHQDAFRDHYGHVETSFEQGFPQWWHHITEHPHYDPTAFFLAMDGNEIAGYIFCYPQDYEFAEMAWIDTLGVRRPWRNRGLGVALLRHIFGEMVRRGQKRVGLAVDASSLTGATRLYEKAGMKTFRQFDRYSKELRPGKDLTTQEVTT